MHPYRHATPAEGFSVYTSELKSFDPPPDMANISLQNCSKAVPRCRISSHQSNTDNVRTVVTGRRKIIDLGLSLTGCDGSAIGRCGASPYDRIWSPFTGFGPAQFFFQLGLSLPICEYGQQRVYTKWAIHTSHLSRHES